VQGGPVDVTQLEPTGPNAWRAGFQPGWTAFGGIHGGLVVAVMLRAAELAGARRSATISVHFHSPVTAGEAELHAKVTRSGRSSASVNVVLSQAKACATALVLLEGAAERASSAGSPLERSVALGEPMPVTTPLDTPLLVSPPGMQLPFGEHVEIRPTGDTRPLAGGKHPVLRAWIRLRGDSQIVNPAARAAVLLDALAPSLFAVQREPIPIPTIELTIHLAPDAPVTPWSAIAQSTSWWSESYCVDDALLRNEEGALIAQARQRRRILGEASKFRP
jgi:acyl-CoA thioesterase